MSCALFDKKLRQFDELALYGNLDGEENAAVMLRMQYSC